jgi:tetratricopeptide (TPR) repeat protein
MTSDSLADDLQTALNHARAGNLDDAERLCEILLQQAHVEAETRHLLGVIHTIQCRYADAEPLLRQAVAESPSTAKYCSSFGNALRDLQRFEEAEHCYRQALALDSGFDDARFNLAKLLHTVQRNDEAIVEYRHVLRNRPDDLDVLSSLAFLLESSGQRSAALQLALQGLQLAPSHPAMNLLAAVASAAPASPSRPCNDYSACLPTASIHAMLRRSITSADCCSTGLIV